MQKHHTESSCSDEAFEALPACLGAPQPLHLSRSGLLGSSHAGHCHTCASAAPQWPGVIGDSAAAAALGACTPIAGVEPEGRTEAVAAGDTANLAGFADAGAGALAAGAAGAGAGGAGGALAAGAAVAGALVAGAAGALAGGAADAPLGLPPGGATFSTNFVSMFPAGK